ncbi:MAG: hypothetical protein M1131_01450 [Actinobacteria bacterium]|nr:hypothetical protein [Actinomycetota bacterium]MCL6094701.1 hypothetical protein [Actinomycetota bacterium]
MIAERWHLQGFLVCTRMYIPVAEDAHCMSAIVKRALGMHVYRGVHTWRST